MSGDVVLKVLVLGDPATGKTSIIKRTITNSISDLHKPTIVVDFHFRKFDVQGTSVALQLWDIAGQDRFGALYRIYYRDAFGAMLVFDLSRPETFQSVLKWKREIDNKVMLPNGSALPVILLANKSDLPDTRVNKEELDAFCKEHGFVGWLETSAKTNHNIEESVKSLVTTILSQPDAVEAYRLTAQQTSTVGAISLSDDKAAPGKPEGKKPGEKSGCCSRGARGARGAGARARARA
jgi:Ras-related protein Rab-32